MQFRPGLLRRRRATLALAVLLVAWYVVQVAVTARYGQATAEWLFYFPQGALSPGVVLSPLSHHLTRRTHLLANVGVLLAVGLYAEPHLDRRILAGLVLGGGYASILIANALAPLTRLWIQAGTSGGVFALVAYAGILFAGRAFDVEETAPAAWVASVTLLATPAVYVGVQLLSPRPHAGHLVGIAIGLLVAAVHWYADPASFGVDPASA